MAIVFDNQDILEFPEITEIIVSNDYELSSDSELVQTAMKGLVHNVEPFVDWRSNPEIATDDRVLSVYKIDGKDPNAVICRAIEGEVMLSQWNQPPTQSKTEAEAFEDNSTFFLVLDVTNPTDPKAAASLRIADCLKGDSETQNYFLAEAPEGTALPPELEVNDIDRHRGLWDVVGVMATDGYRDGVTSIWAYHALYKASQESGVHRWISNITDKELKNLHRLGIPFEAIDNTPVLTMEGPNGKPIPLTFQTCNVDAIRESMTEVIAHWEEKKYPLMASMARVALDGRVTPEIVLQ